MEVAVSLPKYLKILSGLLPAGAVGASMILASAAPATAHEEPNASTTPKAKVSERLAAIRDAVSEVTASEAAAQQSQREPMFAWWNGGFFFRPWGNWGNGWSNWSNGWQNWNNWHNWGNY